MAVQRIIREWEIQLCSGTPELNGRAVISPGSILRSLKSSKPNPSCLARIPYLCSPFPPRPLSHSSVVLLLSLDPIFLVIILDWGG
ncbi:unnamed protein product [Coffea canephora]|uniref:Uncharacterized protein n=1 Tax=Coffea canephora TaxID=49390 RepID=A0A068TLJ6_COFCA|nr:unnamed protein product [Coffea canephora]